MFEKILIANRGEIAMRIIRACRELGVRSVAVFSEADRDSLHLRRADEAYHLGESAPAKSYLDISKIIEIAERSGAQAIHPGYGFLAENPNLAQACEEAKLAFIGPSSDTLKLVGDKLRARKVVSDAGVPVIPGSNKPVEDEKLREESGKIGFPIMVKAVSGGGGKGIRIVRSESELSSALDLARSESESSFGSSRLYLEKCLSPLRHIEVQILADKQGNAIHLGERECSIQRRHQKLLEETPSPFLSCEHRNRMTDAALKVTQAASYTNAGTVEFLVDEEKIFYFLEVNARIQVEHPVTEAVTGVDLVKQQIRIAAGEKLRYSQSDIKTKGAAIEVRVCAEDVDNDFAPSTGIVTSLNLPAGPGIRVDSGLFEGMKVTPFYDSMLGKLVAWGEDRDEAIARLRSALKESRISGIKTTLPLFPCLLENRDFRRGEYDAQLLDRFIASEYQEKKAQKEKELEGIAMIAAFLAHNREAERRRTSGATEISARTSKSVNYWKMSGRPGFRV